MEDRPIPPRLKPFTWWDRQGKKAYAIIPPRRQSLTCSYPFGMIFLRDFRFHNVIYPHLYVICNPDRGMLFSYCNHDEKCDCTCDSISQNSRQAILCMTLVMMGYSFVVLLLWHSAMDWQIVSSVGLLLIFGHAPQLRIEVCLFWPDVVSLSWEEGTVRDGNLLAFAGIPAIWWSQRSFSRFI